MARNNNDHNNGGDESNLRKNKPACAACKKQRKGCVETCPLAPYFPHTKAQEFNAVHDLFGLSNVQRMLKQQETHQQKQDFVDSLIWNAEKWKDDPIHGPRGAYLNMEHELESLKMLLNDMAQSHLQVQSQLQQLSLQQQQREAAFAFGHMNSVPVVQNVEHLYISQSPNGMVGGQQQGQEPREVIRVVGEFEHVPAAFFQQNLRRDHHANHHL